MSFKLFTDSGSSLDTKFAKDRDITIIPLSYTINGVEYQDLNNEGIKDFYKALRNKEEIKTSATNTYVIKEYLKKALDKGEDVLYIAFSSGLSITYQNALKAKEELEKEYKDRKIIVIDSLSAALGEGLLVKYSADFRDDGESIEDVASFVEANKLRLSHLFTVEDIFYLKRGGRMSKPAYLMAKAAMIKPIMHADDEGKLALIGRTFGRKQSVKSLIEKTCETIEEPEKATIFIAHGDALEEAQRIKNELENRLHPKEIRVDYLSATIGAHSGPGTLAIFYFAKHRI